MDESRARALLRAERAEVATLLRETEDAATLDDQASDIPEDFGDQGLPLTENADDEAVAEQLRDRLAAGGPAGVGNVFDVLRSGIDSTLLALGRESIHDLGPDDVIVPDRFTM